jgi:hypothetical protein
LLTEAEGLSEYYRAREEQIEKYRVKNEDLNNVIENTDIETKRLLATK